MGIISSISGLARNSSLRPADMPQDKSGTIRHLPDSVVCKKKSINLKSLITQSFAQDCIITGGWRSSLLNSSLKVDQTVLGKKEGRQRGGGGELQTDRCHR